MGLQGDSAGLGHHVAARDAEAGFYSRRRHQRLSRRVRRDIRLIARLLHPNGTEIERRIEAARLELGVRHLLRTGSDAREHLLRLIMRITSGH